MSKLKISKYYNYFFIFSILLVPCVYAQQKSQNKLTVAGKIGSNQILYKADEYACYKINDISESFAEKLADAYKSSTSSIFFKRVADYKFESCTIMVETPIGPKKCSVYTLVKIGNKFIATPYMAFEDGGLLNMVGKESCSYN